MTSHICMGFSCSSAGKESAHIAGDLGSIPGLGRSPGEGKGHPLQYSVLENSMDYIVYGVAESDTTWVTFTSHEYVWLSPLAVDLKPSHSFFFFFLSHSVNWLHPNTSQVASQVELVVKNLPANAGEIRDTGSIPGSGRSPGGGHGNPLHYSCRENPVDRGAWWATVHRVAKTRTQLKRLTCIPRNKIKHVKKL